MKRLSSGSQLVQISLLSFVLGPHSLIYSASYFSSKLNNALQRLFHPDQNTALWCNNEYWLWPCLKILNIVQNIANQQLQFKRICIRKCLDKCTCHDREEQTEWTWKNWDTLLSLHLIFLRCLRLFICFVKGWTSTECTLILYTKKGKYWSWCYL